eukprot:scaffold8503_cov296-Pinguiococcus_pyrenoidosus.AAC.3
MTKGQGLGLDGGRNPSPSPRPRPTWPRMAYADKTVLRCLLVKLSVSNATRPLLLLICTQYFSSPRSLLASGSRVRKSFELSWTQLIAEARRSTSSFDWSRTLLISSGEPSGSALPCPSSCPPSLRASRSSCFNLAGRRVPRMPRRRVRSRASNTPHCTESVNKWCATSSHQARGRFSINRYGFCRLTYDRMATKMSPVRRRNLEARPAPTVNCGGTDNARLRTDGRLSAVHSD